MVFKIMTATLQGMDAAVVEVEADVTNGLPVTNIVGLADTAIQESRVRVRAAIRNAGFPYPQTRVSINLAPGNVPKMGTHFDIPIALAILISSGTLACDTSRKMFIGEMALDGQVRPCSGVLAMVISAKEKGFNEVYVPQNNLAEASLVQGINILGISSLKMLVRHLTAEEILVPVKQLMVTVKAPSLLVDFKEIAGQHLAKRGLEIAAAGNHNIRMTGPPGSGKTMLAKAFWGYCLI